MNPDELENELLGLIESGTIKTQREAQNFLRTRTAPASERQGAFSQFATGALASGRELSADVREMFGGNTPELSESRRQAQLTRAMMPRPERTREAVAQFLGSAAPDIAGVVGTTLAATALTGGLGTAPAVAANLPRVARAAQLANRAITGGKNAGALSRIARGTIAGEAMSQPLVTIPSALSEESMRSPSRAASRYAAQRRQMEEQGMAGPTGTTSGILDRALRGVGEAAEPYADTALGRYAFDTALGLGLGLGGEAAVEGLRQAPRALRGATDFAAGQVGRRMFGDIGEGAVEAGTRGAEATMRAAQPRMPSAFDPFRQRDAAGNPFFDDQPFTMAGEDQAARQAKNPFVGEEQAAREAEDVIDAAVTAMPAEPRRQRKRIQIQGAARRATPEGEASRLAEDEARVAASQARIDASERVAEFDRSLTQAAAEAHRLSLRRAAAEAAGEPMPAPRNPNAVTTGQQAALEALRSRAPGLAMGAGLGASAAMSDEDADQQAMLAMAALGMPVVRGRPPNAFVRTLIVEGFNSSAGIKSLKELASQLGVSATTVQRALASVQGPRQNRVKLLKSGTRAEEFAKLQENVARLFNSGMDSQSDIANALELRKRGGVGYVANALRDVQGPLQATRGKRGINAKRNPNLRFDAKLANAFNTGSLAGRTREEIIDDLGISNASISKFLDNLQGPRQPNDPMSRAMRASLRDRAPGLAMGAGLGAGASMAGEDGEMDPALAAAGMLFGLPTLGKQGQQDILSRLGSTLYGAHNTRLRGLRGLLESGGRELSAPSTGIVRPDAPMVGYSEAGRPTQLVLDRDFVQGRGVTGTGDLYSETNGSLTPYLNGSTLENSTEIMDPATRTMLPLNSESIRQVKSFLNTADPRGSQIGKIIDITGQKGTSVGSLGLTPHSAGYEPMSGLEAFGANLLTPDQFAGQAGRLRGIQSVVNANATANVDLNAAMETLRTAMRDIAATEPDALGPLARKFFEAERQLANPRAPASGRFPTDPVSIMAARGWQGANNRSILDPDRFSADDFLNPSRGDIISPTASGRAIARLDDAADVMAEASNRNQATPVNYLEQTGNDILRLDRDVAGALMPESALRTADGDAVAKALAGMNVPVGTYADPNVTAAARNFKVGTAQMLEQLQQAGRNVALPAGALAATQGLMPEGEEGDALSLAMAVLAGGKKLGGAGSSQFMGPLSKKAAKNMFANVTGRGKAALANLAQATQARLGAGRSAAGYTSRLTMAIEKLPKSWSSPRPLVDWENLNVGNKGELQNIVLPFVAANGGKATAEEVIEHLRTAGVQGQAQGINTRSVTAQNAATMRFSPQYKGVQNVGQMQGGPAYGEDVLMAPESLIPQGYQGHFSTLQQGTGLKGMGWSRWFDEPSLDGVTRTIGESQSDFSQEINKRGIPRPFGPFDEPEVRVRLAMSKRQAAKIDAEVNEIEKRANFVRQQALRVPPPAAGSPATFFMEPSGQVKYRTVAEIPNADAVVDKIVQGLGGKRQEKFRVALKNTLGQAMLGFPDLDSVLRNSSGADAQELFTNSLAVFRQNTAQNVQSAFVRVRRDVADRVRDAQDTMMNLSRVSGPMGRETPEEIANAAVRELGAILLPIVDDANNWARQTLEPLSAQYIDFNRLRDQRRALLDARGEASDIASRLEYDLSSQIHNSTSAIREEAGRLGMFTTTMETTFANTANSMLQAIRDGVRYIALDTPASRTANAGLKASAAEVQYGINLPSAVNSLHRALGVEPKWSQFTSMEDGVVRNRVEITPELRDMIGRFGAPLLGTAAMVIDDDEKHGRYATAGLDMLDIGLIAMAGGAIGGKKILDRLTSMGASKAAKDASKVQLMKVAKTVAERQAVEAGWERYAEREARNRARIRDYTFPYPDDAGDPVRDQQTLLEYAGRILTDVGGTEEMKEMTEQFIREGKVTAQGRIPVALEQQLADELAMNVSDLATRNPENTLSGTELLALGKQYQRDSKRKAIANVAMTDRALPEAERDVARELHRVLEDRLQSAWQRLHRDRSQKGRDLNLLKQAWRESSDTGEWLYRAQQLAGGRVLDDNLAREIINAVEQQDFVRAQIAVAKARKGTLADKAGELFQTNLLASVSRPVRDLIGGGVNAVDRAVWMKLAGYYDRMAASMVPNWNRSWGTSTRTGDTLKDAAKSGTQQAVALMRGGTATAEQAEALRRAAQRYDFLQETAFESPMMQAYAKVVRRMTAAADQPFYEMAFAMAIESQAMAMAEATGRTGAKLILEADRIASRPTPQMLARARDEALEGVWQQQTLLGTVAKSIGMRTSKSPGARLIGKLLIPFAQTPSAIATQAVKQTPLGTAAGVMMDAVDIARANNVPEAQRNMIKKLAMGTTGAAWLTLGYILADDDNVTGDFPKDENERAEWDQTGKIPNALKVGAKWVSLSGLLGPQAILIAIGAEMNKRAKDDGGNIAALTGATVAGTARTVLDSPVAQGLDATMNLFGAFNTDREAEAIDRFASSYAGGAVPRIVGQAAAAMDEAGNTGRVTARDIRGSGNVLGRAQNALLANIPGLRETLPEKVSVFGDTMTQGPSGPLGVLSPFRTSARQESPLTTALDESGYFPTTPDPRTIKSTGETLTREMIRDMRRTEGPEERALLEGILANDEEALSYVTDAAMEEYETTGDLGRLLASAIQRLRLLRTQERRNNP